MPTPTWFEGLATSLKTQTATWLVAFVIGLLGLFSGRVTESVKFALNRADLRTKQYEELATDVSAYIFAANLTTEFIENGWTTKEALTDLVTDYNNSITSIRKKEFVYEAWIKKFWGSAQLSKFNEFLQSVAGFDKAVHSLNDEFEKVNITKTQQKIDPARAKEALQQLKPDADKVRQNGRALLESLI
jgi:hypothetical protein